MKSRKLNSIPVGELVSIFQRGKTWYCNYQQDRRQVRKSLKTTSKKQATLVAQKIETELNRGAGSEGSAVEASVGEVVLAFLDNASVEGRAEKTLKKYRFVTGLIQTHADKLRVGEIRHLDMRFSDSFRAWISNDRAPKTVHTALTILRSVVLFAVRRRMTATDPLLGLRLPKPKPTPQPFWTPEVADQIVAATPSRYRPYLTLLRETGCRAGEAKYLTWKDVDFARGCIHIRPKLGWKPKSGDTRRAPMSDTLRQMLLSLPRRGQWVFTAPIMPSRQDPDRQISERRALQCLKKVLKTLGQEGHLHTFRHTFISQCATRGIPESVIRDWVGHVDPKIMRIYMHVSDDVTRQYLQRFSMGMPPLT